MRYCCRYLCYRSPSLFPLFLVGWVSFLWHLWHSCDLSKAKSLVQELPVDHIGDCLELCLVGEPSSEGEKEVSRGSQRIRFVNHPDTRPRGLQVHFCTLLFTVYFSGRITTLRTRHTNWKLQAGGGRYARGLRRDRGHDQTCGR